MARIKIDKVNEYYNVELIGAFPDEVCILGGGYTEEEAIAEMKANAETWLEYEIKEAKLEKYWNGERVELPCKIGDVMYEVIEGMPIQEWKIESICFNKVYPKGVIWAERTSDFAHWKFWIEDCGTKWFVTKAEAKQRLEELKNEP